MKRTVAFLAVLIIVFNSCSLPVGVFEKNSALPDHSWSSSFKPTVSFDISDTVSLYRIYVVLRHSDAYRYKNLWVNVGVQPPGDSLFVNRLNLILGNDEKGWLGKGMDDIFEHRVLLENVPRRFNKTGTYNFTLQQIMREDPLEHVLNVGIRLEKVPE